jgi:hypothetical protein
VEKEGKLFEIIFESNLAGWLSKRGGMVKNWKRRWIVLKSNFLYYYKAKGDGEPLGFIPIDRCTIKPVDVEVFKKPYCFEITDPCNAFNKWHKSYFICSESEKEMKSWIDAILGVKAQHEQKRQSMLSMEHVPLKNRTGSVATVEVEQEHSPFDEAPISVLMSNSTLQPKVKNSEVSLCDFF